MNLDDYNSFTSIDKQDMMTQIETLPDQLRLAWELGHQHDLPGWTGIRQVVIAGMGGSAISADLLAAYIASGCRLPVFVQRDYELPAWAREKETLFIASSHSGNTEETLSALEIALAKGCRCLIITTGGKLEQIALKLNLPLWSFQHLGQPRAAVGFSFGLLLALFKRLGFIENPEEELWETIQSMQDQQKFLRGDVPVVQNPAKRFAGQLIDRYVTIIGSGVLAPVARRWKGQLNEIAKTWAQFELLPEADHNTISGVLNPGDLFTSHMVLFLRAPSDHPRNHLRGDLTRKSFMLEGLGTDFIDAHGESSLAHQWTCLHFGDYVAYYLSMAYGVDPSPVPAIESFKQELEKAGGNLEPRIQ